jgi:hypothetical protein
MWFPLAHDESNPLEAELYARTGLTKAERQWIRPVAWAAEKGEQVRDAQGNWTVRGRFFARRFTDIGEALDAAGTSGEIEFRDMYGVVYSGADPLAADKAARYEREHRARMSAERRRRKRLGKWLRRKRNDAEVELHRQQQEQEP